MAMKRANGTGSVYKMKHKKLRKPYRAMVYIGQDSNGKILVKQLVLLPHKRKPTMPSLIMSTTL